MAIQYRRPGEPRKRRVGFLSIPPSRQVRILVPPDKCVQVYLHWCGPYSVPCLGDECDLCDHPPFLAAYAAAAWLKPNPIGSYFEVPTILCITDGALELAERDLRGRLLYVSRFPEVPSGRMTFVVQSTISTSGVQEFPIHERLETLWLTRPRINLKGLRVDRGDEEEEPPLKLDGRRQA